MAQLEVYRRVWEQFVRWIESCKRRGRISRNTVGVGLVVIHHLQTSCPVGRKEVLSKGGEIRKSRGGRFREVLRSFGLPENYLKEVTTRQAHQDGQKLLQGLEYGHTLSPLPPDVRTELLGRMAGHLVRLAMEDLQQGKLQVKVDRRDAPVAWIRAILDHAQGRSGGVVEQHLVGAKLATRFPQQDVPNFPTHAGDAQTKRPADFVLSGIAYHVTKTPSLSVIEKCKSNVASSLYPVLLVPMAQLQRATVLAEEAGIAGSLTIVPIETFVGLNVMELGLDRGKEFFEMLQEVVALYNKRVCEVETDMSLQIEVE